ncbi:MAG: hypothetical protein EAY75_16005 [Bacteroidetes bacterium]|nr:MAG: hypothetical protein EAY75_16005 [Bacteroidota bacterium]
MNNRLSPAEQIEATLNSLDGIERAAANPFLYTRVQAKLMAQLGPWEKAARLLSKPALAICIVILAMATNLVVVSAQKNAKAVATAPEPDFSSEFATVNYAFAEPTKPAK